MKNKIFYWRRPLVMGVLGLLVACSPIIDQRGHVIEPEWKERIIPGTSTKEDVTQVLGSPSSVSSFGSEVWYYISARKETKAFLKPEVVEQDVIRIEFSSDERVASAELIDKSKAREDFEFVKRTTPTEGHSLGVLEQLLGNLGRFNRPGGSTAGSTINRPGGR